MNTTLNLQKYYNFKNHSHAYFPEKKKKRKKKLKSKHCGVTHSVNFNDSTLNILV